MNLLDYVKANAGDENKLDNIPEGDTLIVHANCDIEPLPDFIQDNGKAIKRYKLKTDGRTYRIGWAVYSGIRKAIKAGARCSRITRQGLDKDTRYIVVGVA